MGVLMGAPSSKFTFAGAGFLAACLEPWPSGDTGVGLGGVRASGCSPESGLSWLHPLGLVWPQTLMGVGEGTCVFNALPGGLHPGNVQAPALRNPCRGRDRGPERGAGAGSER